MTNYYTTSRQHLLAELERVDLLIRARVQHARQVLTADEEFQGLFVSDREVEALLARPIGLPNWAVASESSLPEIQAALDNLAADIGQQTAESTRQGVALRLVQLARLFQLTRFDIDVVLICLAPELDLRYEHLYAYLQDDVTKKRPSVDLVLNLLSPSFQAKLAARERFAPTAPLLKHHLLQLFDDPSHVQPPLLSKFLKVDARIVNYLLDSDELDVRISSYVQRVRFQMRLQELLLPADIKHRLARLAHDGAAPDKGSLLYFQGSYGVGKQTTAAALCGETGKALVVIDVERLSATEEAAFETTVQLIVREARLQGAALYWDGFDALLADDQRSRRETLLRELEHQHGLIFLAGNTTWELVDALHDLPFMRIEFHYPTYTERVQLWASSLNGSAPRDAEVDLSALANKFRFSGGQIRDAAATARNLARWRDPEEGRVTVADLYAACRLQSNRKLAALARSITPRYTWNDIVLPADRLQQLHEICSYVKYRALVYGDWGFDRKLALGKGLNILFAGPSGTGKTMSADIIAGELGLDLYKIDLSTVVSKYIGETEKNLARIFAEAETSNAILFFDEADALFGKRSEVRDSHDRYANIEIAYLLQRMEEYDGVVILATNLSRNMDDAFVRRMHATVEFPFPDVQDRQRIWERIWPAETPLQPGLDFDFMARRFEIAGGNIRNIALAAAFLAADDGKRVNMAHLIRAIKREYQKMGKVVVDGEFGEYARLVTA
jgi:SpoVK/Ycf46/Vps4 family AAA+-type ATPase